MTPRTTGATGLVCVSLFVFLTSFGVYPCSRETSILRGGEASTESTVDFVRDPTTSTTLVLGTWRLRGPGTVAGDTLPLFYLVTPGQSWGFQFIVSHRPFPLPYPSLLPREGD